MAGPAAPPPTVDPREAARLAAEARAKAAPAETFSDSSSAHSPVAPFNPSAADKLPFHRLIDTQVGPQAPLVRPPAHTTSYSQIIPKTPKTQLVKTLTTLQTLTSNILTPPNPAQAAKFRQLRIANKLIQSDIVNVPGAYDYLVACGFRATTVNFEAYLTFSSSPTPKLLHSLRVGNHVLGHHLARAHEAEDREKRMRESEKEAEKARVGKALLGFEEDRRLKREKDEREKLARAARLAREAEEAANPSIVDPSSADPDAVATHPLFSGRRDASTMDVDPDLERDDDYATPPPSYGMLHGRVLGTGAPPAAEAVPEGVRMVSAQDLEESDEE
ncbi:hypothetical protein MNV49_003837 [Pseudohyphozyma bogoriensis]|nr:hypothetical protein MNV49_003837 [Pseudohyphozyma bogoriensis]